MRNGWLASLSCLLLARFTLHAQVTATGTIQGTITDKTDGVIPGADVRAASTDTGLTRETRSNDAGQYRFDLLPTGVYELRVMAKGFGTPVFSNVVVAVGQTTTIDAQVSPSAQTETVTVEAVGAIVDVTKTHLSRP